ncbi:MAG: hypothetical protein GXP03_04915 [Alphaproteobacteria bacterium]|nr:hypothetical protein [Alphaproteobacteria bacterium]
MGKPSARNLLIFLLIFLAAQAGLLLGKSVLVVDQHEGDALHLMQIALRMADGQWPHLDFMTPIGVLAFAPVAWLLSLGYGAGAAMKGAMVLMAAIMLPGIWWVAYSRLSSGLAYVFGALLIVLVTALVYGGDAVVASISMYYNRWAWAVAFLLVTLAVLPAQRTSQGADGVVYGLGLAFLALSKITFFAAFLPGILLALVLRRQFSALGIGVVSGLIVVALVTLLGGVDFWAAYIGDLRAISGSGIRPRPGVGLAQILTGPGTIAATLVLIAAVVFVRQTGRAVSGAVLLFFTPAFIYVTYQNWGNDPKWLILLPFLLLSLRPRRHLNNGLGWDLGRALGVVSLLAAALFLPSLYALSFANIRHARLSIEGTFQVIKGPKNADFRMRVDRMYATVKRAPFTLRDPEMAALAKARVKLPGDSLFGQPLDLCKLHMGLVGILQQMAVDVDAVKGTAGKSVFVADTFSNLWLFGDTVPVPGASPWYYGLNQAYRNADFLLVPLCPVTPAARSQVLAELPESGVNVQEVMRNELFILLRVLPD